jgi:hypothetical protein
MNIYEKMLQITSEISTIAKNLEVKYGTTQYRAVGEADVLRPIKKLEKKYGIYSYPKSRQVIDRGTITNSKGTNSLFMRVETEYCFVNVEKPEEQISVITYGDGVDTQDKAPGKAMTYADKYALLKAYKIVTGDDPDQQGSATDNTFEFEDTSENLIDKNKIDTLTSLKIDKEKAIAILNEFGYKKSSDIKNKDFAKIFKAMKENE